MDVHAMMADQRAYYEAGRESQYMRRRNGLALGGAAEDFHFRSEAEYQKIVERARSFDRDDTVVSMLADRACDNIVGPGFLPEPKTGDRGLDKDLAYRWEEWSTDSDLCDEAGESVFADHEWNVCRSSMMDGDIFVLPTENDRLQLIENHLCRTPGGAPSIVLGVEMDDVRCPVRYWFASESLGIGGAGRFSEPKGYPARDERGRPQVFHVLFRRRPTMARGVSVLRPIFPTLAFFEDTHFATMLQAQIVSFFAILRTREKDGDYGPPEALGELKEQQNGTSVETLEGIGPGMMVTAAPGEKLEGFSPNTPTGDFRKHMDSLLELASVNFGLPLMIALMQPQGSYSAYRGALQQAQMGFTRRQLALVRRFHQPVWWWRIDRWADVDAALGRARKQLGDRWYRHIWNRPAWPYIDPMVDTQSGLLRLANGLISPRRLHAENGRVFRQVARETMDDNTWQIIRAKKRQDFVNTMFPHHKPIDWREICPLPTATGQSISIVPPAANDVASTSVPAAGVAGGA